MRVRTWWVAALGLFGLLVLIAVSMLALSRKAEEIYGELDQLNIRHHEVDAKLRRLRSDVNLSGIFVRDYLLDVASVRAPEYRRQLAELRDSNMATLAQLRSLAGPADAHVDSLQAKLDDYWQTFEPLFDWTAAEKILQSARFLRREVVPRRDAVLSIAQAIEELNNTNLAAQRVAVDRRYDAFREDLHRLMWRTLLIGLFVAVTAAFRLRTLERRSEEQRAIAQTAEHQMRLLSQRLVAAQEAERTKLSRELHDHIAQVLTALRMELARIDRSGAHGDARARSVAECRQLVDQMFRTVRDLALGLRPSMLDDFGLQAALEWHVRDFRRRYGVDVFLDITGTVEALPDTYRTCVYRAVQEAMTNCVRHAKAREIKILLTGGASDLHVSVADDGVGIDPTRQRDGLGLRGIEERVKELGGAMTLVSGVGRGTTLTIRLPLPAAETEEPLARAVS
jgi:signal transduction histidine kinase